MSHQECWELLPWLANGSLDAAESQRVAEHLEICAICREEERACRELGELLPGREAEEADRSAALSPEHGFARLSRRIDTESAPSPVTGRSRRLASLVRATPPAVRTLVAAQMAALLLLAALAGWTLASASSATGAEGTVTFRTLSDAPGAGGPAAAERPRLRVVFSEDAELASVRELLVESEARLVDGPSPFGVYAVELAGADAGSSELSTLLSRLRRHPAVVFAEPAL